MLRFIGRAVGLSFLALGIVLTFVVAITLIAMQLLGDEEAIEEISCRLDLSQECVRDELAEERRRLEELRARTGELEALYERLTRLDHASESFTLFYSDYSGPNTISSGHRYASLIDPETFISGWCYIHLPSPAGVSIDLFVARMGADRIVTRETVSDEALAESGLTQADIDAALQHCRWPEAAS